MMRATQHSKAISTRLALDHFALVWQKDHVGESSPCVLVAAFILDTDASDWVLAQNKSEGQDLYFFNVAKQPGG